MAALTRSGALAMLMLMLMPATAASIPAVKSAQCPPGYIVSGGYCTPMFRPAPGLWPYCPGIALLVPCIKACISSGVSWPSLLASIPLKIRS